jgi:hypothetical protein
MKERVILSLCDESGIISRPYREAGYTVIQYDLLHGHDVRLSPYTGKVHGIISQPPCTHFAGSGARWWKEKGDQSLLQGLSVVDACLRMVAVCQPVWWMLENPVGRLRDYIGPPAFSFNPCDYAGLSGEHEAYTKKTLLWGNFIPPLPVIIGGDYSMPPIHGSKMHKLPPSPERAKLRSKTPVGFAKAFFIANP